MRFCVGLAVSCVVGIVVSRWLHAPYSLLFVFELVLFATALFTILVWLARRIAGEARALEWVKNLALLFSTLVVMVFASEIGLRVLFSGITTTNDNSSYWARRWLEAHQNTNRLRFREREFSMQKAAGVNRIVVLGDSFTYGQGVEEEDRFTNRLQAALGGRSRAFEVLNFGAAGAQTEDELRVLENTVIGIHPDFVLLQWFVNDVEGDQKFRNPRSLPPAHASLRSVLHSRSALYYVLERQWGLVQEKLGWEATYEAYMLDRLRDPTTPDARRADAVLSEFAQRCRENHVPLGIVLFPNLGMISGPNYSFDFLHERVLAWCRREGIDCLDLRRVMRESAERIELLLNRFDGHPSPEAHRIAAEEILAHFRPVWDREQGVPSTSSGVR